MRKVKLLVVDDEEEIREIIIDEVKRRQFNIECVGAENGKVAFELIKNSKFDIVLSDFQMPLMNGIDLIKMTRDHGFNLPFIFLTGHNEDSIVEGAWKYKAVEFIQKPFDIQNLLELVSLIGEIGSELNLWEKEKEIQNALSELIEKYAKNSTVFKLKIISRNKKIV